MTNPLKEKYRHKQESDLRKANRIINALEDKTPFLFYDDDLDFIDIIFFTEKEREQHNEHQNYVELSPKLQKMLLKAVRKL